MARKKTIQYIDNEKFTKEVTIYAKSVRDAIDAGEEPPRMNSYIGKSLMDIAKHMGARGNFNQYSWLEDMKGDAIEDVIKYLKNFDPEKLPPGKKPSAFAYVSRTMWFGFLRRMGKEKKQQSVKQLMIYNAGIIDDIANIQDHDDKIYINKYLDNIKSMADDYYKMIPTKDEDFVDDTKAPSEVRNISIDKS